MVLHNFGCSWDSVYSLRILIVDRPCTRYHLLRILRRELLRGLLWDLLRLALSLLKRSLWSRARIL